MKKAVSLLCIAVALMLMGCVAAVPGDTTAATKATSTVDTTDAQIEPMTQPTVEVEAQAPTQPATTPTEQ